MSLNIKNPEAHALGERLAKLTGETLTDAVSMALRERLAQLEQKPDFGEALLRSSSDRDGRPQAHEGALAFDGTWHGDLLYDERGLPK
jgi:antitoxin VapB